MDYKELKSPDFQDHKKINAKYAGIVSRPLSRLNFPEADFFEILYFDNDDNQWHCGFGSYIFSLVSAWLKSEFEPTYNRLETAITDLLARAEAEEARCKLAEKCFDDSALHACETQLELEKKARLEAEARAEKAERERDECKAKYCAKEPCTTCIHYEEKDCDGDCLSCTADCPCNKCEEYSMWAWNGQKEE